MAWCRINRHQSIPDRHAHLIAMMRGHYAYYGITGNFRRLSWHLLGRRQFLHLASVAAAVPAMPRIARAQSSPTRPIRLLVPFPPGGAFDTIGRPWADKMKAVLGTVVVAVHNQISQGSST